MAFILGTVPGSTPPALLAATRGYHLVIEEFKKKPHTDFLIENKFKQNILHIVLKAGYYNKIGTYTTIMVYKLDYANF